MKGATADSTCVNRNEVANDKDEHNSYPHRRKCYLGDNNESFLHCFPGSFSFRFLRIGSFATTLIGAIIICPWVLKRYHSFGDDNINENFLRLYTGLIFTCFALIYLHAFLFFPPLYERLLSSIETLHQCHGKVLNVTSVIVEDGLIDTYSTLFIYEIEYTWPKSESLEPSLNHRDHLSDDSSNYPIADSTISDTRPTKYYLKVQKTIQNQDPTDIAPVEGENVNIYIHPSYPRCAYTEDNVNNENFITKPGRIKFWSLLLTIFFLCIPQIGMVSFIKYPWQFWYGFAIFLFPPLFFFGWTIIRQIEYKFYNQAFVRGNSGCKHLFINCL